MLSVSSSTHMDKNNSWQSTPTIYIQYANMWRNLFTSYIICNLAWISRQVKEIIRITSRRVVAQSLLIEFDWSISGLTKSSCKKCSIYSGFEFSGDISSCLKHEIFRFYKPNQIKLTKKKKKIIAKPLN